MAETPPDRSLPAPAWTERPLPPQATMGLLNYITAHSLDEDYAHVSARRRASGEESPEDRSGRGHPLAFVALAMFGLLVATAGVQTARNATTQETSRDSLVTQVKDRREELANARTEVNALRASLDNLQKDYLNATAEGRALQNQLTRLGVVAGAEAVTGPGVRIVVDDNPRPTSDDQVVLDTDLQRLVNGLWASGAEAIAVNGHRLTNLTAIRTAGEAITVGKSLSRPYVVEAIGDPEQLPARFIDSDGGSWWLNLKSVYHLKFEMTSEDDITVPAAPSLKLRVAQPPGATP